jgi:hypothetical protein
LGAHPKIALSEFFAPWLNRSVEDILGLDTTSQVHKARSDPELTPEFEMVVRSVEAGRRAGIAQYLADKKMQSDRDYPGRLAGGALPVGTQVGSPAISILAELLPKLTIVHLVRAPLDCIASVMSRRELDGDAALAAAAWVRLNGALRRSEGIVGAGRYVRIRYEDLKTDTAGTLRRLCEGLGVTHDTGMLENADAYHGRNSGRDLASLLSPEERSTILEITAPERAHYGYAPAS